MIGEEPRNAWPKVETMKLSRDAVDIAPQSMSSCRRINVKLLRLHMQSMIPYSQRWVRASETIRNLEA